MIDYALLKRQSDLTQSIEIAQNASTAYGQRLKQLSKAYHFCLLSVEAVESYLDELVLSCEKLAASVSSFQVSEEQSQEKQNLLKFLSGILDLSEELDLLSHRQVVQRVEALDDDVAPVLVRLSLQSAA